MTTEITMTPRMKILVMIDQVRCWDHFNERPQVFDSFSEAAGKPLYPGCTKYTQLSGVLTLFNIKEKHNMTNVGFMELLEALQDMFPEGNLLPKSTYVLCKKINVSFGL